MAFSGIKVADLAYIRLQSPDLDRSEEFLRDFGLIRSARTDTKLFMRGTDPAHHIHVTELGEPRLLGLAFAVADRADLEHAAALDGAGPIEPIDEPGGGERVRLIEPNGYPVDIVHGIAQLAPIAVDRLPMNSAASPLARKGILMRHPSGPTPVKRIAHAVMGSPDVSGTVAWFRDTLGLIQSDDIYVGSPDTLVGSFNRVDRGQEYVDHHAWTCLKQPHAGLNHVSFEVPDIDAVFNDHHHLKKTGKYEHVWGIGRHTVGSQIYDYWSDPWGRIHEHWSDSDRLNADSGSFAWPPEESMISQWGDDAPPAMMTRCTP